MRIIIGLFVFAVGIFMVIKTKSILHAFGRIEFFERYLGSEGGSRLGYKIIGLIAIFIGFLMMTNMISDFLGWILSPLISAMKPS